MRQQADRSNGHVMHTRNAHRNADAQRAPTDAEVVQRVLAGDNAVFELLMRRYNQRVYRVVRSIVADADEAEDIAQDAFVRAYQHLSQFEGRSSFSTWLTRIAVYEASSRRRRLSRQEYLNVRSIDQTSRGSTAGTLHQNSDIDMRELNVILARAVEALPDELRTVFMLRMVEGLNTIETSECLNLTASNVKVRLHRARQFLQEYIDGQIGAEVRKLYQFDGDRCDRMVMAVMTRLESQLPS